MPAAGGEVAAARAFVCGPGTVDIGLDLAHYGCLALRFEWIDFDVRPLTGQLHDHVQGFDILSRLDAQRRQVDRRDVNVLRDGRRNRVVASYAPG